MLPPDVINTLPPAALRALSEYYRNVADDLAYRARALDETEARRQALKARRTAAFDGCDVIAQYMAAGLSAEQALAAAASVTGMAQEALRVAWSASTKARQEARDRAIVAKARRGMSNADIAADVGLSAAHVGRIIRRRLK